MPRAVPARTDPDDLTTDRLIRIAVGECADDAVRPAAARDELGRRHRAGPGDDVPNGIDRSLMLKFYDGWAPAFDLLHALHNGSLLGRATHVLRHDPDGPQVAAGCVDETWVRVWQSAA